MSTRLCLFGATEDDYYFIENKEFLENNGYNLSLIITNHSIFHSVVSSVMRFDQLDLSAIAALCDSVVICKSQQCFEPFVIYWIGQFLEIGLNVVNCRDMDNSHHTRFANQAHLKGCKYEHPTSAIYMPLVKPLLMPVIFVISLYNDMNKMSTELGVYKELVRRGYKAKLISSNSTGEFFGVNTLPLDMFLSTDYTQINNQLNSLIRMVDEAQTDVLVVGIPSTLFAFNAPTQINVPLYMLNSMCLPDYVLLSVFDNTLKNNEIHDINAVIMQHFGVGVDAMLITNTINDVVTYENTTPEFCFHIASSGNDYNISDSENVETFIVHENEKKRFEEIVNNIEQKLGV